MRSNNIRDVWASGGAAVCAWLSIGNSYTAEIAGWAGYDCVLVDLQHGMTGVETMISMLQAISATPATPIVRVPSCDPALIMKALDAGAFGIICPMIDSARDARTFVAATRYPPLGNRSFGPARGLLYGGASYPTYADASIVRLGMIETLKGLEAVDEICAVEGLDGIFVGPNDVGLAMGKGTLGDPTDEAVRAAILLCLSSARAHGKHAGIFCPSSAVAARRSGEGFDFVVPNSEANLLKSALAAEARAARQTVRN
ncbi:HpcH/HpaI aldolase family protein [Mesorhizobium sp. ES1-6]|uniref:HpcH/HpaI aldolase family protein n=1 Tax=Mesorhizobium sp. ES1-6 TaxID=2876626 RepID=UPI001CCD5408|nr:aldolase/citrate lyase family protein [Mesorhizobium sp. ES1-6]MBZ9801112.1 2,4-dihydroxyhept-2-ene-1,7-dioic acid aldolase [Mesorhizobium sp. ES1-6]